MKKLLNPAYFTCMKLNTVFYVLLRIGFMAVNADKYVNAEVI